MVTFRLMLEAEDEISYEYYPEGDENSEAGRISINVNKSEITVCQPAERDMLITATVDGMKAIRDSINEMRAEQGRPLLTDEELPMATEESCYYCYASKAMEKIFESYKNGVVIKNGTVVWY